MKKNFTNEKPETRNNLKNSTSVILSFDIKWLSQPKFNLKLQSITKFGIEVCPVIDTISYFGNFFCNREMKSLFTPGRVIFLISKFSQNSAGLSWFNFFEDC